MSPGRRVAGWYHINHIEKDVTYPNSLLYSDGQALLRLNLTAKKSIGRDIIAGKPSSHGFHNDYKIKSRFYHIYGFVQVNKTCAIAVDLANNCLSSIDMVTGKAQTYAGECETKPDEDFADGNRLSEARFQYPQCIIILQNHFYLTDKSNDAIRSLPVVGDTVNTVMKDSSKLKDPRGITADPSGGYLFVTIYHGVVRAHPVTGKLKILIGGKNRMGGWRFAKS